MLRACQVAIAFAVFAQVHLSVAWGQKQVGLPSMTADHGGGCIIDVFGAKNVSLMEYRFTWQVLLSHTPHLCGCRFLLKDRELAPEAIKGLQAYPAPSMLLIAARGLQEDEAEAIQQAGAHAKAKLVVIHQSDERNNHSLTWYPKVKAVFRNYHRDTASLKQHMAYLTSGMERVPRVPLSTGGFTMAASATANKPTKARHQRHKHRQRRGLTATAVRTPRDRRTDSNVFWIPLGSGEMFVHTPALQLPISARPLLWSWTGSLGGKPERSEMVKCLNTTEMLEHAVLYTFHSFKGPELLPAVRYSTYLYESKLIPLPPGIHPEQFRIYEALAAGAIPVILKTHQNDGMAHVAALRFKVLWLNSWREAPRIMREVHQNAAMQQELNSWQQYNTMQYGRFVRAIKQKTAEVLCAASSVTE